MELNELYFIDIKIGYKKEIPTKIKISTWCRNGIKISLIYQYEIGSRKDIPTKTNTIIWGRNGIGLTLLYWFGSYKPNT